MLVAKRLTGSLALATIGGLLFAIDGNAIVMSRVALLDNFVMLFALLGFGAILLDREQSAGRLALWVSRGGGDWGPAQWWRPWLVAAGAAFGAAAAVKWNGLYFLAGFAVYALVVDALARRRAGIPFWLTGTVLKQAPATFLLTVPVAALMYLASWTGWFVTEGGYDRQWAAQPGNAWTGPLAWVPHALQSLWHFQVSVYDYHVGENPAARLPGQSADLAAHGPPDEHVLPLDRAGGERLHEHTVRREHHGNRQPAHLVGGDRRGGLPARAPRAPTRMAGGARAHGRRSRVPAVAALPEPHRLPVLHDRVRALPAAGARARASGSSSGTRATRHGGGSAACAPWRSTSQSSSR